MTIYSSQESYRDAWQKAATEDPPIPLNVDIDLASTCNLRCPSCFIPDPKFEEFISQKSSDGKSLRRLMPKEMAFKIIDQCAEIGVPALKFNWRGESTLHPDYSQIVKYAQNKNSFLELLANTNANCSDKTIDGLMNCTKVMVSLDSMVPETYAQMRVGGNLGKAKEIIWELVRRGHPNLWIRRVLTKLNAKENFFEHVKKEWGEKVKVSEHSCFDRNATQSHELSGCDHDQNTKRKYCEYPSQRMVVTSRGFCYPCCIDLKETLFMGDIHRQSILEIWQGEKFKALRKNLRSLKTETWSETCKNCESWMSFDAPQRDFVQDREGLKISLGV
jgi:Predicted Fe-S oxidoreductases